jgi:hypothetical protein
VAFCSVIVLHNNRKICVRAQAQHKTASHDVALLTDTSLLLGEDVKTLMCMPLNRALTAAAKPLLPLLPLPP